MKNNLSQTTIYLLIAIFISACAAKKESLSTTTQTNKEQEIKEINVIKNTTSAATESNTETLAEQAKNIDETNAEISALKLRIHNLQQELGIKSESISVFDSPYSLFNQQIVLDNGTVYYGNVIYQDDKTVTVETLIGKLNLERERIIRVLSHQSFDDQVDFPEVDFGEAINPIEDGKSIYKSPAEIILLGNIAQSIDENGNQILQGRVKNTGGQRADFVKINITLYRDWSSTQPPKTISIFVNGSTMKFDEDKISQSSVEPKAVADFALVVPSSFGSVMSWTWTIDFEQY
tara:strand:- start:2388 stop:3260 length:873 start_codon:yes stop_codon:yes gene_type:complete